jgi:hypothetical protein
VQLFERIAEETLYGDRALFDSLTAAERKLVVEWLAEAIVDGKVQTTMHDLIWEVDFIRKPPDIETFLHDEYYLGRVASFLHPKWKDDLREVFRPGSPVFEWIFTGAIGVGKGLATSDVVLTPDGWRKVESIRQGDLLIGQDGKPTRVEGVYPRGRLPLYRVEFDDGNYVNVDGDHLWTVQTPTQRNRGQGWQTRSTADLADDLHIGNAVGSKKWHIPLVEPVRFADAPPLPIAPYALGALIGDGGLTSSTIRFSSKDLEIVERVARELDLDPRPVGDGCDYRMSRDRGDREEHPLSRLRDLGVSVRSEHKRIPRPYLFASVEDRWELLRGLMDTDGWVQNRGRSTLFCTASLELAGDVQHLVESLGGVASRHRKKTTHLDAHILDIRLSTNPFWVPRKADEWRPATKYRPRRMIASITPTGEDAVVCFKVAAPDGLFVVRHFIVTHNTTVGDIALAKKLCDLSCLRDPSRYYGLLPNEKIVFGIYSKTLTQAADAGFYKLRGYLDVSPYFREHFPRDPKIDTRIDFEPLTGKKIQVAQGSRSGHALGLDLFAFLMDEANFMDEKEDKQSGKTIGQAYELYNATYTRLQSRFGRKGGSLPGMVLLVSSRNAQTSFLEEHTKSVLSGEHAQHTFVSDYAVWEIHDTKYTFPGFTVEVGDRLAKSRILKEGEKPRSGARVVELPLELRRPADLDLDQTLRDMAGIATFGTSPLIRDRASIFEAVHPKMAHPFTRQEIICDIADSTLIEEHYLLRNVTRVVESRNVPRLNPKCPRFIHVDIGLTNDSLGFAMGHVAGTVKTERVNAEGTVSTEVNPYIIIDLMLRVSSPAGGEVDLSKVRAFILYLRRLFPIAKVTFDQFQSSDSIQILKKQRLDAGHQSVDKRDDAYLSLRSAFFDRRIATYRYDPFIDEVLDLERDVKKRKVDHPKKASKGGRGSKDVSDAVAGVIWLCMNDDRALHDSVADLEIASRARTAQAHAVNDPVPPDHRKGRLGVTEKTWDDLRANV